MKCMKGYSALYKIFKDMYHFLAGRTECQQKAYEATHPMRIGAFIPQCNDDGSYARVQCWGSTGYCWCASEDGTEWPGTRVRGQPKCDDNKGLFFDFQFDGLDRRRKIEIFKGSFQIILSNGKFMLTRK